MAPTQHFSQPASSEKEVLVDFELSPRLSVILCTLNRRNLVLSALASLRRQTLPTSLYEIVVVDNGSSDGTLEAVRTYAYEGETRLSTYWHLHCHTESRPGLLYARNTGLRCASGDILVFLDDDTLADCYFLERLLQCYDATGADAVGPRVALRWEAPRPRWLYEELLTTLGYFQPSSVGGELPAHLSFSSCCFSLRLTALQRAGGFFPLSGSSGMLEVADLCQRLRSAGCKLWYEPEAHVIHRVPSSRLRRGFFIQRMYARGRAEVCAELCQERNFQNDQDHSHTRESIASLLRAMLASVRQLCSLALFDRPLLLFRGHSSARRFENRLRQAHYRGRLAQQLHFLDHLPTTATYPALLFIVPQKPDKTARLLLHYLQKQRLHCQVSTLTLSLSWLWRHRARKGRPLALIHFYKLEAEHYWHYVVLWLYLRLVRQLGIRIVMTDTGGWWHSTGQLFLPQYACEQLLLQHSDLVVTHVRRPEHYYRNKALLSRMRTLPHPGFAEQCAATDVEQQARYLLGLPTRQSFVYLCLASYHTEREVLFLIDAYLQMRQHPRSQLPGSVCPQLLLVGTPADKKRSALLWQRAALDSTIHLSQPEHEDDAALALYLRAAHMLVLPHFAIPAAGMLEEALLALSYARGVVIPKLPRFAGLLPKTGSVPYDPGISSNLTSALLDALEQPCQPSCQELQELDTQASWTAYARRLRQLYKDLLRQD